MRLTLPPRPLGGLALLLLAFSAAPAPAAMILVQPADWSGSRTTPDAEGVHGVSAWASGHGGFRIAWEITLDGGVHTYRYTLSDAGGGPLGKEVSHFLLQVSDSFTAANVLAGSDPVEGGGPGTYTANNSAPGLPRSLFALKFDSGDEKPTYTLVTDRAPVWGSFYAKDGEVKGVGWVYAHNSGLTGSSSRPEEGADFTRWVPTPDTVGGGVQQAVPVPPSLVLMAVGGAGVVGLGCRPRRGRMT